MTYKRAIKKFWVLNFFIILLLLDNLNILFGEDKKTKNYLQEIREAPKTYVSIKENSSEYKKLGFNLENYPQLNRRKTQTIGFTYNMGKEKEDALGIDSVVSNDVHFYDESVIDISSDSLITNNSRIVHELNTGLFFIDEYYITLRYNRDSESYSEKQITNDIESTRKKYEIIQQTECIGLAVAPFLPLGLDLCYGENNLYEWEYYEKHEGEELNEKFKWTGSFIDIEYVAFMDFALIPIDVIDLKYSKSDFTSISESLMGKKGTAAMLSRSYTLSYILPFESIAFFYDYMVTQNERRIDTYSLDSTINYKGELIDKVDHGKYTIGLKFDENRWYFSYIRKKTIELNKEKRQFDTSLLVRDDEEHVFFEELEILYQPGQKWWSNLSFSISTWRQHTRLNSSDDEKEIGASISANFTWLADDTKKLEKAVGNLK